MGIVLSQILQHQDSLKKCNKTYSTKGNLKKHIKKFHSDNKQVLNSELQIQDKIDSDLTPIDSNLTPTNSNIKLDKRKKFICQYCDASFTRKNNLHP